MKILSIAGITFQFTSPLPIVFPEQVEAFSVESAESCNHRYEIVISDLPKMPESKPFYAYGYERKWFFADYSITFYQSETRQWNCCLKKNSEGTIIYLLPEFTHELKNSWSLIEKIDFSSRLLEHGAVMLHSSYLIYDGQAILFTAASCVGKSTQAELWRKTLGAEVINGDRSIIREKDGRLWAFGTPYSGTSGICKNVSAPIRAIVTLEQAPGNTVRTLTRKECTRFFLAQTTIQRWNPEDVIGTIQLWDDFIQKVPVLRLACRPDEDAVYTLKNYLDALDKEKPL